MDHRALQIIAATTVPALYKLYNLFGSGRPSVFWPVCGAGFGIPTESAQKFVAKTWPVPCGAAAVRYRSWHAKRRIILCTGPIGAPPTDWPNWKINDRKSSKGGTNRGTISCTPIRSMCRRNKSHEKCSKESSNGLLKIAVLQEHAACKHFSEVGNIDCGDYM